MKSREIEMLDGMLLATQNRTLSWTKNHPGKYDATGASQIIIQEICPLIAGDTETAGVQAFQVEVNRVTLTFWSGTIGCEKVREILAAAFPEFSDLPINVAVQINEVIERLKAE